MHPSHQLYLPLVGGSAGLPDSGSIGGTATASGYVIGEVASSFPASALGPVSGNATFSLGAPALGPDTPCAVCGTPYGKHGTFPTCASHDFTRTKP